MNDAEQHSSSSPIKVLVVDDSPFRRQTLQAVLNDVEDMQVIGTASNGQEAIVKTLSLHPDVITMDVQMPIMNGFEAIDHIMQQAPKPIIVISGIDVNTIVKALSMGAMDFVSIQQDFTEVMEELIDKIRIAALVQPIRRMHINSSSNPHLPPCGEEMKIIAIGVSTGGPAALTQLFQTLPDHLPLGIIVVQHITTGFIQGFVQHLQSHTHYDVQVAQQGQRLKQGQVLFAPDDQHLLMDHNGCVKLSKGNTSDEHHITSIDLMMSSAAELYREQTIGILMTGMGRDGVEGMDAIKQAGGTTIAQNEQTSTVFGMNCAAIQAGYADYVLPLQDIGPQIVHLCEPINLTSGT